MTHWSEKWLGIPYLYLGRDRNVGLDCLGLTMEVMREEFGVPMDYGVVSLGKAENDMLTSRRNEWRRVPHAAEGDVLLFHRARAGGWHIGVALSNEQMLHTEKIASCIERFRASSWSGRLEGAYRYAGHRQASGTPAQ